MSSTTNTAQQPDQGQNQVQAFGEASAPAKDGRKPKQYFPFMIKGTNRITVAPLVGWSDLASVVDAQSPQALIADMWDKANALRALSKDLLTQAEQVERNAIKAEQDLKHKVVDQATQVERPAAKRSKP